MGGIVFRKAGRARRLRVGAPPALGVRTGRHGRKRRESWGSGAKERELRSEGDVEPADDAKKTI